VLVGRPAVQPLPVERPDRLPRLGRADRATGLEVEDRLAGGWEADGHVWDDVAAPRHGELGRVLDAGRQAGGVLRFLLVDFLRGALMLRVADSVCRLLARPESRGFGEVPALFRSILVDLFFAILNDLAQLLRDGLHGDRQAT